MTWININKFHNKRRKYYLVWALSKPDKLKRKNMKMSSRILPCKINIIKKMWKSCSKWSMWKSGGRYAVSTNSPRRLTLASVKINTTSRKGGTNNKMSLVPKTRISSRNPTKRIRWRVKFGTKSKMTLRTHKIRKLSARSLQTTSLKIVANQISYMPSARNLILKSKKITFASSWE